MIEIQGTVRRRTIGRGSKSEHEGVVFETADRSYVLRRSGGHAFRDEVLEGLVGKTIIGRGKETETTFLLKDWDVIDGA